ncbi:MAG: UDP-glucuronic acid decarboxylase family protein [Candidatus Nitrospinota bacterium M3_3B_026]
MPRYLVTGGAGFIGSWLCERLLGEDAEVVCVDDFSTGAMKNIESLEENPRFTLIERDITRGLSDIEGPFDYVLNLASPASPVDYGKMPIETLLVGSAGTHAALDLALRDGAAFLLASTSEVYGDPEVHPQREGYWGKVNPVGPRSCYDEAKRYAEAATVAYRRVHGLDVRIARIFNTFGPRMRVEDGRAVTNFICQALRGEDITVYGDGSQTRSFCYITDLVDGLMELLRSGAANPVNLGNDEEMTILELAKIIIEKTGSGSRVVFKPLPQDDPARRRPDISRARELLRWEPKVSLKDGLLKTIEYYTAELGPGEGKNSTDDAETKKALRGDKRVAGK